MISRMFAVSAAAAMFAAGAQAQDANPAVTGLTEPRDGYPDISPDGSWIAFQSNRTGTWQIWVTDADGSNLVQVTHDESNSVTPVWSPDGTRILFASDRAGGAERDFDPAESFDSRDVWVMDVSQGLENAEATAQRLTEDARDEMHPEWAEGGETILYNRVHEDGEGAHVVAMNAEGTGVRVVREYDGWDTYAAMTPDGEHIVWRRIVSEERDGETVQNSDIFIMGADGSNPVRLTDHPAFDGWPTVSPDGETIAFSSRRGPDNQYHVHLMDIDGGNIRQITHGTPFHYTQPAWSADGSRLAAFRWIQDEHGELGHIVTIELEE